MANEPSKGSDAHRLTDHVAHAACDAHAGKKLLHCEPAETGQQRPAGAVAPTVRLGIELAIPVGKNPGLLAQVLDTMAGKATIWAYCTSFEEGGFTIFLVTDDAVTARTALIKAGLSCSANSVVLVRAEGRGGTPAALFEELRAAGIGIWYAYVATLQPGQLCAIFKTDDDRAAIRVLAATGLVRTVSR